MAHVAALPIIEGIGALTGVVGTGYTMATHPHTPSQNILGPAGQGSLNPAPGFQPQNMAPNLNDFLVHLQNNYNA